MPHKITKESLKKQHPIYNQSIESWRFFWQSYVGGKDYFNDKNLFQHSRETKQKFEERLKRAYYLNYAGAIIETYIAHLSKQPPLTEVKNTEWEGFTKNVDRRQDALAEFRREVQIAAMVLGHTFVIVDKPMGDFKSKKEENESGLPFFVHVYPWDVLDWDIDQFGEPNWVKIREVDNREVAELGAQKKKNQAKGFLTRVWWRDVWALFDSEGKEVENGTNDLGRVPIVVYFNRKSAKSDFLGVSAINDIAFINRRIFNLGSLIDEFVYNSAFPMLSEPQQAGETAQQRETGVTTVWRYPATATHKPEWLSPPTEPLEFTSKEVDSSVSEIQRLARVEAGFDLRKRQATSGVAKAFDWLSTSNVLAEKADNFEEGDTKIFQMWQDWQKSPGEVKVDYPDEFDVQTLASALDDAMTIQGMNISEEFEKNELKKVVKKAMPKITDEEFKKISDEIDINVDAKFEDLRFGFGGNDVDNDGE